MMINSFSFHLSKKTHIISFNSEWKSCWVENSWLKVFFFLLALWICYTTFFWPAEFLLKNQQIPLWAFLVYNKFFFFSWWFWDNLFIFNIWNFKYNLFCYRFAWIYLIWNSTSFLDLNVCFLPWIREVFSCYFSKFSGPFFFFLIFCDHYNENDISLDVIPRSLIVCLLPPTQLCVIYLFIYFYFQL